MEYYAHYDKERNIKQLLREHLTAVAQAVYEQIPPVVQFKNISNENVKDICYWLGYFHDLGKYTDYFQRYLLDGVDSPLKNHAHISACYTYNFLQKILYKATNILSSKIVLFLCYLTVRLHHLSLRTSGLFPTESEKRIWNELLLIEKHLRDKAQEILDDLELGKKISIEDFVSYLNIDDLRQKDMDFKLIPEVFKSGRIKDAEWYFLLIYLFSLLIDLDKLDSAEIKTKKIVNVSPYKVDLYLKNKHSKSNSTKDFIILNRREKARHAMLTVVESLTDEEIKKERFFLLTAPTGIGKTLSSLQCALRLQERIKIVEQYTPRIITAIPFINIIEQHRKDYQMVIGSDATLVVHHQLTDFSVRYKQSEEVPIDRALLEVESWEGDVILTTFVQFFHSILTNNNRLLKKTNKLTGSIVILDEAQAVPEDYMPLIGAILQKMAECYGTRFILMTATQPKLLEFGNLLNPDGKKLKPIHLLPEYKEYFLGLKRTKLIPLLEEKLNDNSFVELLLSKWDKKSSVLIVVNTIKRSVDVYNAIEKALQEEKIEADIFYLSTNIIPKKRREVIQQIEKKLKQPTHAKPIILVSTQTIEAGVDLDFDMAFRDFAPLDSIIQTAGRVNREGKKGNYLPIYIIQLESDSHYIYPLLRRENTKELLTEKREILEPDFGKLVEEYYSIVLKRGVKNIAKELWTEGILKLDFDVLQQFHLIKELGDVYDVFIEDGSEVATILAEIYQDLRQFKEYIEADKIGTIAPHLRELAEKPLGVYERKALLKLILAKMSDYIVQVRVKKLFSNRPPAFEARGGVSSPMFWVPPGQREDYYNETTGFISESDQGFVW